jgi:hypothetical protein
VRGNLKGCLGLLNRCHRWWANERGNVGPLLAIMAVPLIGAFAIATESGSWFTQERSQQNAADSGAIAAALKRATSEGTTVASSYGYPTSTISSTMPSCPSGALSGATCYRVAITRQVPVYLSKIVGYNGDATVGGLRVKTISAAAIAGLTTGTNNFCLIGLSELTLDGGPNTDLTGCQLLSGGDMACNGNNSDTGVSDGYAVDDNKNGSCGSNAVSNYSGFTGDPKASTVTSNLSGLCTSYTTVSSISSLSSGVNCLDANGGTISVTGPITVNDANTVLVVQNGGLNIGANTISTAGTGSLTIVWTGATGPNAVLQSSGGTIDIAAPNSGIWSGMALIEDPSLAGQQINVSGVGNMDSRDFNFSGGSNSITLNVSGLIYLPNAEFNLTGSINKASNGYFCLGIIADVIVASGTNAIFANPTSECRQAGLSLPTVPVVALLR